MSQVTLESVEIIEIQTFVIGLPVGPTALPLIRSAPPPLCPVRSVGRSVATYLNQGRRLVFYKFVFLQFFSQGKTTGDRRAETLLDKTLKADEDR